MKARFDTPTGPVSVSATDTAITRLRWSGAEPEGTSDLLEEAGRQLAEYFAGARRGFDLPLAPRGNDFQLHFYAILCAIPYGETRTYGEIAAEMGASAQAIGQACGANPIPIFIPCHRVLGANGLGGFSGGTGIETKVELLKLEGAAGLLI
ncbi:methylated-DNA--[protein]-cysteine S-methyltransferase [Acidimangrovimonas sediminis]|uniref:methylated-DNA--[protein]-cysteine S-methyltransferase n=1 Tax=Acidimangrovimonas sediminis TaxID=2056283 RepID=UPI000C8065F3|nr:methylated-DNA--[protein]-cysteine S-methyltransferase [Acidimangrovimonas sediminis]